MNPKTAILSVLNTCGVYALMKPMLKVEVEVRLGGKIGDGEFSDALVQLKDKGLVGTRVDDLTGDTRYHITETGKTRAAQ
jgi:DNA-binding PadR family transcriptional regulator